MRTLTALGVALIVAGCAMHPVVPALAPQGAGPEAARSPRDYRTAGLGVTAFIGDYVADYATNAKSILNVGSGRPSAVAFSTSDDLWVAQRATDAVSVFAPDGKALRTVTDGIHQPTAAASDASGNVYIVNKSAVTVYAATSTTPIRTIANRYSSAIALAPGIAGTYVAESDTTNGATEYYVLEYAAGGISLMRTISLSKSAPVAMTSDAKGTLYLVATRAKGVFAYARGATQPTQTILSGIDAPTALATDASGNLYVANAGGRIAVYAPGASKPAREFRTTASSGVTSMTFDRIGCLFVATSRGIDVFAPEGTLPWASVSLTGIASFAVNPSDGFATVGSSSATLYSSVRPSPVLRITQGATRPIAMLFDSSGNRYVITTDSASVYAPNQTTPLRTIRDGHVLSAALDAKGNLYLAYSRDVKVYAPGQTTPSRTITDGIKVPVRLAIDAAGNLYSANRVIDGTSSVTVYAPGGSTPIRTLKEGVYLPDALAFDAAGDLVVGNQKDIQVFAGGTEPSIRRITQGVSDPLNFNFDAAGNLYCVNGSGDSVTEYEANSTKLLRTFSGGLRTPQNAALDDSGLMFVSNYLGDAIDAFNLNTGRKLFSWYVKGAGTVQVLGSN